VPDTIAQVATACEVPKKWIRFRFEQAAHTACCILAVHTEFLIPQTGLPK